MYKVRQDSAQDRERKNIAKLVRSAVRLHYSMAADGFINDALPAVLEEHARCTAEGVPFKFDLGALGLPALPEGK